MSHAPSAFGAASYPGQRRGTRGLEGAIAKRADNVYQLGQRTGLWSKYRVDLRQEFVVGGYIPGNLGVDSLRLLRNLMLRGF